MMNAQQRKSSAVLIKKMIKEYGGITELSTALRCTYQQLWKWSTEYVDIPLIQAYKLSRISKFTLEQIRPDLKKII